MRAIATGLALGLASMAWAATSAPATTSSAPLAESARSLKKVLDLSTPTAAVAVFLRAAQVGDLAGMQQMEQVLDIAEGDRNVVRCYINLAAASAGVVKAAEKQFGPKDAKVYYDLVLVPSEAQIKEVDQATVVITGDQASVTLKSGGPRAIELKRKTNGQWRIDAGTAFDIKAVKAEMDTIKKLTAAMNGNRTEIDKGEFGSAMAAVHALQGRLLEIAEARRAESAATSAATRP